MTLQAFKCPSCGSSDLEDTAWNTTKCRHCGTVSRVSEDRLRVEILVWACPRCGFNNEREVRFCAKCGQPLLRKCPICKTETRGAAEFCENCGINLREGLVIGTWLDDIRGALRRYGVAPSMVARVVEGPFLEVFQTCATVLAGVKVGGGVVTPVHGLKDVSTNAQTGEITAKQDPRHTWPKSRTVRVLVQPGSAKQRGVAVICTERYRTAGSVTTDIANRVAEAIWAQLVTLPLTIRHNP